MEAGTVLIDAKTGLELLVVESPSDYLPADSISVEGRSLVIKEITPAGSKMRDLELTTDPGQRG